MSEKLVTSKFLLSVLSLAMLFVISVMLLAAVPVQAQQDHIKTGRVHVPGIPKFVAADFFVVNHPLLGRVPGIVKIGNLRNGGSPNDNFERYLLGKIELDVPATNLSGYIVQELSSDAVVRSLIDDWGPLGLWDLYAVLARQPNGERGLLLTNGGLNYFHVRGTDNRVWVLLVYWPDESGWSVTAVNDSGIPYIVHRGAQVISLSDPLETR